MGITGDQAKIISAVTVPGAPPFRTCHVGGLGSATPVGCSPELLSSHPESLHSRYSGLWGTTVGGAVERRNRANRVGGGGAAQKKPPFTCSCPPPVAVAYLGGGLSSLVPAAVVTDGHRLGGLKQPAFTDLQF